MTICVVGLSINALMTYVIAGLYGLWPVGCPFVWLLACVAYDLWLLAYVAYDLCTCWPVWPIIFVVADLYGL